MSGAKCDDELAEKNHSDNEVHDGGDEEDVPEDFFDDFSNQDFMAGLDVVDAWDDEETNDLKNNDDENSSKEVAEKDKNRDKDKDLKRSEKRQESRKTGRRRRSSRERRFYRSRASSRDRHSEDRLKRVNSREMREERRRREKSSDRRRDPEKTRRDIQRDKDRRTKDEEAKIISEKLRVVETGLVPPGMEMDLDITAVKTVISDSKDENTSNKHSQEKLPVEDQLLDSDNQIQKLKRSRSKSTDFRRLGLSPPVSYNVYGTSNSTLKSPLRTRGKSRSRSLRRSHRGRRSRSRSLGRGRSPVYVRKRSSPSRYYNSSKRTKSPSPGRKRRKSCKSPDSDVSDREVWLQRRREELRRSTSLELDNWPYNRENSSSLRHHRDFLEDLERKLKKERSKDKKKKDFLREIHKKLNETGNSTENNSNVVRYAGFATQVPGPVHVHPNFMHVPHPIAPSIHIPVNPMSNMMINQISLPGPPGAEFVPGSGAGPIQGSFNPGFGPPRMIEPVPAPYNKRPEESQYNEQFFIGHPNENVLSSTVSTVSLNTQNSSKNVKTQNTVTMKNSEISIVDLKNKDTVKKLFEEKKISLADYLSLTATESDPSKPVDIQNKIRVISRCQDAIKALDKPLPVDGRFILKKGEQKTIDKISEAKGLSPLRKIPIVRFQFTTPSKGNEEKTTFSRTLEKVLGSIGLGNSRNASSSQDQSVDTISSANTSVNTIKSSFVKTKPVRAQDFMTHANRHSILCQTPRHLMKCQICEIRNARTYESVEIQCNIKNTVDVGVQCTEEKSSYQDAFKTQSLVHLTPAQILKQMGGKSESFSGNQNGSKFDQTRSRLTNEWFSGSRDVDNSFEEKTSNRHQMPLSFERSFGRSQQFDNRHQTITDRSTQMLDRQLLANQPQMNLPQGQGLHDLINNQFMQTGGIPNLLNMNVVPPRNRSNFNPFL